MIFVKMVLEALFALGGTMSGLFIVLADPPRRREHRRLLIRAATACLFCLLGFICVTLK